MTNGQVVTGVLSLVAALVAALVAIYLDRRPKVATATETITNAASEVIGMLRAELARSEQACDAKIKAEVERVRSQLQHDLDREVERRTRLERQVAALRAALRPDIERRIDHRHEWLDED